jgi:TetR/AcrR family transcriptional regulator
MSAPYYKNTFDRIPAEKRARVIDTAIAEFALKGFDNANINTIAEKAGVSVGSLYKYFDSKESLFLTVIHFGMETLDATLRDAVDSTDDILVKVEKIVRLIQKHSRQNQNLIRLYNEITSESNSELVRKISRDMEEISSNAYSSLIIQAQEQGEARKDLDPHLFAYFVDSLFMTLQFSYACEYYQERFKIYAGEDILEKDELVVQQFLSFIKAAFT